jgi:hypothetical protein
VPSCTELVSGVSQLAQNATIGFAAICGHQDLPPQGISDALIEAQGALTPSTQRWKARMGDATGRPTPTARVRGRSFAPWAAAEFFLIDNGSDALRLSDRHRPATAAGGRVDLPIAGASENAVPLSDTPLIDGTATRRIGGYLFFGNTQSASAERPAPSTLSAAAPDSAPVPVDAAKLSGDSAADVEGDNRDVEYGAYDVTPDSLLSRGGITLSAGYSSVEGASVGAKISRQNIGGMNRELAAGFRLSQLRQIAEAGYGDANFLGSRFSVAPKLFAHRTTARGFGHNLRTTPFSQSAYGFIIQLSRKFGDHLSANASYRLSRDLFRMRGKNATCDAQALGSVLCDEIGGTTNSLFSLTTAYDRRKQNSPAMRGYRLRLGQDIGLGGSAPFTRTRIGGDAHIGISERWTLMLDAEGGYLASLGRRTVPLFDRFYAGDTSLRGFDLRGVGPKLSPALAAPGQDVAIGGRAYYAARAEVSGALGGLFDRYGLKPGLFVDAGSVFGLHRHNLRPGETISGNSAKPRISVGFGLTMKTPGGTLRLDFARPIASQQGDRPRTFSFTFGAAM